MGVAEAPGPDLGCEIQGRLEPLEWEGQEGLQGPLGPEPKVCRNHLAPYLPGWALGLFLICSGLWQACGWGILNVTSYTFGVRETDFSLPAPTSPVKCFACPNLNQVTLSGLISWGWGGRATLY